VTAGAVAGRRPALPVGAQARLAVPAAVAVAAGAGAAAAWGDWFVPAGLAVLGLLAVVWSRPHVAAYVLLFLTPFLVGVERGRLVPVVRLHEALLVLLGTIVLARLAVLRLPRGGVVLRLNRIDAAILLLALTSSVLPLLWLVARGRPVSQEDALSTLAIWKLYAVFALVRATVRTEAAVRGCLVAALAATALVAIVATLQSTGVGGVGALLERYWEAPSTGGQAGGRASATFGSSIATADYLAYGLAIALAWGRRLGPDVVVGAVAVAALVGAIAAAQFSGFVALAVVAVVVARVTGASRLLVAAAAPATLVAGGLLWPAIHARLTEFSSPQGVPSSWLGRWDNLSTFYLPELADFNFVLGVTPNQVLQAPETWREVIFLESGHLWLLWVGGIPLLAAYAVFVVRGLRASSIVARSAEGAIGVAGVASLAALAAMAVLTVLDPHLTLRGAGDLLFVLLALALVGARPAPATPEAV
jgi:hypothetical protein